jgi:hypothetical protein
MNKGLLFGSLATLTLITLGAFINSRIPRQPSGLQWESTHLTFDLPAGVSTYETTFNFKNISNHTVTIQSVRPDCNCLIPKVSKTAIAPRESGKIDVIFDPGDRAGTLERTIEVQTKEFPKEPIKLNLTYHVPELVHVTHRLILWKLNDKPAPQEIDLQMPTEKVRVTGVRTSNQFVKCVVIPVTEGREYKIRVTPNNLSVPHQSVLMIDTDYPKTPWNRIVANVKVQ